MDKTRFTEVKGIEALKILLDGGRLTDSDGWEYWLDRRSRLVYLNDFQLREGGSEKDASLSEQSVNELLEDVWYIPKPFDIRDAALERPNEWVGAYYELQSRVLYKVGFDKELMQLIEAEYENPFDCLYRRPGTNTLNQSVKFESIFPIEQVDSPFEVGKSSEEKTQGFEAFDTDVPF